MNTDPLAASDGSTPTPRTPPDGGTQRPRRRRQLTVIAAAAAVLLAGGGAYWASTAGGGGPAAAARNADASLSPLALDGFTAQHGEKAVTADGGPRAAAYRAVAELPDDGPERAPVYRGGTPPDRDAVAELADALSVPGAPELTGGSWRVGGPGDGRGPLLRVRADAAGSWTYARYGDGPFDLPGSPGSPDTPVSSGDGTHSDGAKGSDSKDSRGSKGNGDRTDSGDRTDGAEPVSEQRAKQAAEPVLRALDLDDAPLDAGRTSGAIRLVTVNPEYGGLPTHGHRTVLEVGADGQLVRGSGWLTAPERGTEYPVLSARETLRELNAYGAPGAAGQRCAAEPATVEPATAEPAGPDGSPGSIEPAPLRVDVLPCLPSAEPESVQITGAVFGLAGHASRGRPLLVPSWFFEVETAAGARHTVTVTHPAVEPRYLGERKDGAGNRDADRGAGAEPTAGPAAPTAGPALPDTSSTAVEKYGAKDRTLTLHFWGGVCTDYSAAVEESSDTVKVRINAEPQDEERSCIMIAEQQTLKVTLKEPVGDREVVDDHGKRLPKA